MLLLSFLSTRLMWCSQLTAGHITSSWRRISLNFLRRYKWLFDPEFDKLVPADPVPDLFGFPPALEELSQVRRPALDTDTISVSKHLPGRAILAFSVVRTRAWHLLASQPATRVDRALVCRPSAGEHMPLRLSSFGSSNPQFTVSSQSGGRLRRLEQGGAVVHA